MAIQTSITLPSGALAISCVPAIVPIKIARKVPSSTRPLPPTSSDSLRCCGKMPYLIGPKKADCVPIRNNTAMSIGTLCSQKAAAPKAMMTISASLMRRINIDFSNLSASCPQNAENRKNGNMKRPAERFINRPSFPLLLLIAENAMSATKAFL